MLRSITLLLLGGFTTTEAFTAASTPSLTAKIISTSTTALSEHTIDTRKRIEGQELGIWPQSCRGPSGNYVPCNAISGHERRAMWQSYAPPHGAPPSFGAIGCPGGGDWCYASSYGAAAPITGNAETKKKAASVAAALAGLGKGVGGARTDGLGVSIAKIGGGSGSSSVPALPSSSGGNAVGAICGEDIHHARATYAPYDDEGRVGTLGEIGSSGSSISFSGGGGSLPVTVRSTVVVKTSRGPKKSYAIGSWQK